MRRFDADVGLLLSLAQPPLYSILRCKVARLRARDKLYIVREKYGPTAVCRARAVRPVRRVCTAGLFLTRPRFNL